MTRRVDFERAFRLRCRAGDDHLVVYVADGGAGRSRLGISAPKRLGGAVVRNGAKRRIREAFRAVREDLPDLDIICIPKDPQCSVETYGQSLVRLARSAAAKLHRQTQGYA